MTEQSGASSPEESPKPRYTLRLVVKPLPNKSASREIKVSPSDAGRMAFRDENEDDDGYDPYSDYHDGNAGDLSFEADPWR